MALILYHSKKSGATKSILYLKSSSRHLFFKVGKGYSILNTGRLFLCFFLLLFHRTIILNGLAVISNPRIILIMNFFKKKRILLYWHESEYQWHESLDFYPNFNDLKLYFIRRHCNIVDSDLVGKWLKEQFQVKNYHKLPEAVDFNHVNQFFKDNKSKKSEVLIIQAVGSLCTRKGIDVFLKLAENTSNHFQFIWTGKLVEFDSSRKTLVERINQMAGYQKIIIEGFNPNPYLRILECDIFLLPSVNEPFGIVYLEALALGRYVIASPNSGFSSELNSTDIGYTYQKFEDLISFIREFDSDKYYYKDMINRRVEFSRMYDIISFEEKLNLILKECQNSQEILEDTSTKF